MIKVDQFMRIKELRSEGHSIRRIAEITGHSRNTVRKVLRGEHDLKFKTPQRPSKLEPYKDYLKQRDEQYGLSAVRLIEEMASAALDRLLHRSTAINITGDSYRLNEKRQAGAGQPA